jgi:hypothetical protein
MSGQASDKLRGSEAFPVDSTLGRVTALGFRVLNSQRPKKRRRRRRRAGIGSTRSGKANWKSQVQHDFATSGLTDEAGKNHEVIRRSLLERG